MFCFFFFLLFVIESSVLKSNPCIEKLFLCCSVLEFISFPLAFFLSVNVDFVAQSLASGTVED